MVVASAGRMSSVTIKRQPTPQQKRKCTRADPTQTRTLLRNYESHARPSAAQFADMSLETNLCAAFILLLDFPPLIPSYRPVEWIKKWFLRKRKADGKNKTLASAAPTLVGNEPPVHDGQTLGHAHSKFWSMDAFVAADSDSFSPSVGRIPKSYGHHRHHLPSGNTGDPAKDSRGNEEDRTIVSPGASAGTGNGNTSPTTYDLREALLGADAFTGYLSPSNNEDTSGLDSDHFGVALAVDDPTSALLPDDPHHNEIFSGSESAADLEITLANYTVSSVSSPFDTIDDFILASKDLDFISATSCDRSKDFEPGSFGSTLDSDLDSLPSFLDVSNYMTSTFGEPSAFYESLLLQATNQESVGNSIDSTDCSGLFGVDFCLGAGADHSPFKLAVFDFCD